jgi:hypothetical protein
MKRVEELLGRARRHGGTGADAVRYYRSTR